MLTLRSPPVCSNIHVVIDTWHLNSCIELMHECPLLSSNSHDTSIHKTIKTHMVRFGLFLFLLLPTPDPLPTQRRTIRAILKKKSRQNYYLVL